MREKEKEREREREREREKAEFWKKLTKTFIHSINITCMYT